MNFECWFLNDRTNHLLTQARRSREAQRRTATRHSLLPSTLAPRPSTLLPTRHQLLATRCFIARRPLLVSRDNQLATHFVEFFYQAKHRCGRLLNRCDYGIQHEIIKTIMKPGFKSSQSSSYIILVTKSQCENGPLHTFWLPPAIHELLPESNVTC